MIIRDAEEKDANQILRLLSQVLELHANIRPDIFISGTTKYTEKELVALINDEQMRIYVAADGDNVLGYAICIIKKQPSSHNTLPFTSLYIDDLCVDSAARGRQIGKRLFLHAKQEAKKLGCYDITLNVWEGNDNARAFYDRMGMKPKKTEMELILG